MFSPVLLWLSSLNTSRQNSTFAERRESILCRVRPENRGGGREAQTQMVDGVSAFRDVKGLSTLLQGNTHHKFKELVNAGVGNDGSFRF